MLFWKPTGKWKKFWAFFLLLTCLITWLKNSPCFPRKAWMEFLSWSPIGGMRVRHTCRIILGCMVITKCACPASMEAGLSLTGDDAPTVAVQQFIKSAPRSILHMRPGFSVSRDFLQA